MKKFIITSFIALCLTAFLWLPWLTGSLLVGNGTKEYTTSEEISLTQEQAKRRWPNTKIEPDKKYSEKSLMRTAYKRRPNGFLLTRVTDTVKTILIGKPIE